MKRKTYRTKETEERYQKVLKERDETECFMCNNDPVYTWKRWKLFVNSFPYDEIAEKSMLLCLSDHRSEIDSEDLVELKEIKKKKFMTEFSCLLENLPWNQSVPKHFHFHLIKRAEDKQ